MNNKLKQRILQALVDSRDELKRHGWDMSRVSIGHYGEQIRVADDTGAADLRIVAHGLCAFYVGCAGMALVHCVQDALRALDLRVSV